MLSVLLRNMNSDYPFGIFKLFLRQKKSLFLFSHREVYIYMWKHYSSTCIYLSQFIRCSRACGSYHNYLDRRLLLTRKSLNHGSWWLSWSSIGRHNHKLVISLFMTFTESVTIVTRRLPQKKQEIITRLERMSSPSILVGFVLFISSYYMFSYF